MELKRMVRRFASLRCGFLFLIASVCLKEVFKIGEASTAHRRSKVCDDVICGIGESCLARKFWCKDPPCSNMIYCSKSWQESLWGPSTCDNVRCDKGFVCFVVAHRCHWNQTCMLKFARCTSEKDYHEGAASCVEFRCPERQRCILRESLCPVPPCKLLRSCAKQEDTVGWFERCKAQRCPSEYECFLRKPSDNCSRSSCEYTPDCITTIEDVTSYDHCRGWICPRTMICAAEIQDPCEKQHCHVKRHCRETAGNVAFLPPNAQSKTIAEPYVASTRDQHNGIESERKELRMMDTEDTSRGKDSLDDRRSSAVEFDTEEGSLLPPSTVLIDYEWVNRPESNTNDDW